MQAFHNTPSLGYIAWEDVHIQYKGTTYNIPNGNTDKRFVIWKYADPDAFYGSDEFPTLGPDDLLVFLNKNGTYAIVPKTQIVDGSLIVSDSIMTDALAANAVTAEKIAAGAITADLIAANAIGAGAIAAGAVTADKIAAGEIATTHLAALAVTADKIAANSVTADKVAANAIGAEKIAAGAISADKLEIGMELDADSHPVRAMSSQIWLDQTGLKMKNASVSNVMMHLNANRLGFWDPTTGDPSIGIGDVADMATALGSDMQYGLLINQGAIVAPESVIRKSLAHGVIGTTHLSQGSVTLDILSEALSVTLPDRFQLVVGADNELLVNRDFETGDLSGWTGTGTVDAAYAESGEYGVKDPDIYQDFPAIPGVSFNVRFKAKGITSGSKALVAMSFLDASKNVLSTVNDNYQPSTTNWSSVPYLKPLSGTTPANTAYVRIRIYHSGSIMIDNATCTLAKVKLGTDYAPFIYGTVPRAECCEQVKIETEITNQSKAQVTVQVRINGEVKSTASSSSSPAKISTTIDVRSYEQDLNIVVYAKADTADSATWNAAATYQNQRLPLRAVQPLYAVTDTAQASCRTTCEASCQASCQTSCQSPCQSTCQDTCQDTCQSICEQTSQGGGCWVAGTPVTIYLPESETATEIPVEQLEPGMIMPYYNPATDALAITECLSNQRSYTHTVFVAEVEGGWTLEMTREQPLDVLRPHLVTGQIMWHRLQARYLRVGDKLIRPFDKTLHEVLTVREESRAKTWVWNPRTEAKRYIVHGFADGISKT